MMYPYMTLSDETEIVHSQLIEDKGIKKVIVNERIHCIFLVE